MDDAPLAAQHHRVRGPIHLAGGSRWMLDAVRDLDLGGGADGAHERFDDGIAPGVAQRLDLLEDKRGGELVFKHEAVDEGPEGVELAGSSDGGNRDGWGSLVFASKDPADGSTPDVELSRRALDAARFSKRIEDEVTKQGALGGCGCGHGVVLSLKSAFARQFLAASMAILPSRSASLVAVRSWVTAS